MMDYFEYQKDVRRTAKEYTDDKEALSNACLGLAGEAGEVVDYLKKVLFHDHEFDQNTLIDELGDVLFYLTWIMNLKGVSLDVVVEHNIEKRQKRYPKGFDPERSKNREA